MRRRASRLNDSAILLDYYAGAYGPTLRIDVQALDSLDQILVCVKRLSSESLKRFRVGELAPVVAAPPLTGLTLVLLPEAEGVRRTIRRILGPGETFSLEWSQTPSEWDDTAAFIEALYKAGQRGESGHQYLTDEPTGDILVELALWE